MTPPFLCSEKIIWLRHAEDLSLLASPKKDSVADAVSEALTSEIPEGVTILIDGPGIDLRTTFAKELKKSGANIEMLQTGRAGDRNFAAKCRNDIEEFFAKNNKSISPDAVTFLIEAAGSASGNLINEMEKLLVYADGTRNITLNDCLCVVSRTPETMTWVYTSAIADGNTAGAMLQLNAIIDSAPGMEMRIIGALANEYQKQIQTHLALEELGITRVGPNTFSSLSDDVKEKYPDNPLLKMHPFRAFKVCEAAMSIPPKKLAQSLTMIRDSYLALMSGAKSQKIVLEELTKKLITIKNQRSRKY
jgi:DNA polymerase III delta subunit